jgi:Tol biopolymer transport system component
VAWVVGDRELWAMGSDASQPRKLAACPFDCQSPRWSPDGHTIAFVSLDESAENIGSVVTMGAAGDDRRQYSTPQFDAYSLDWSPDGTRFAVNTYGSGGGLWVMNVADGAAQKIRTGNSGSPSWARDGGRILFSDGSKLQTIKPTGEGLKQFSKGTSGQYLGGHWSLDGQHVVFDFCCRDGKLEQVGLMNADGTGEHFLTDGAFEAYESTF